MFRVANGKLDAIILQETWIGNDNETSLLQIDGYNLVSKPYEITSHGGLAIYLENELEYEIMDIDRSETGIWEGLFLKLKIDNHKNLTLGNVYRPPRDLIDNYRSFKEEFEVVIYNLTGDVLIGGDFNIDLLKISDKPIINDYFESILACGYIPKITLPTRLTRNHGTLIDNFLCKVSVDFSYSTAGILTYKISDHQPIFICLDYLGSKTKSPKYVKIIKKNNDSIQHLKNHLNSSINMVKFKNDIDIDPNFNYEILNNLVISAIETCMPSKSVKYNKHKHKNNKWITPGLIKSITFRDKLYQKLKSTPQSTSLYDQLKINLNTYNKILKKAIREAKQNYYSQCFYRYKQDIKKTWLTIKDIINKSKNKN